MNDAPVVFGSSRSRSRSTGRKQPSSDDWQPRLLEKLSHPIPEGCPLNAAFAAGIVYRGKWCPGAPLRFSVSQQDAEFWMRAFPRVIREDRRQLVEGRWGARDLYMHVVRELLSDADERERREQLEVVAESAGSVMLRESDAQAEAKAEAKAPDEPDDLGPITVSTCELNRNFL